MSAASYRALLTGAGGGIGAAMAVALAPHCKALLLTGRDPGRLLAIERQVARPGLATCVIAADLATSTGRDAVARAAAESGIDLLINNAGVNDFAWFAEQGEDAIERIVAVNALAPMLLTRRLLPLLQSRRAARIVNVGSIYGYLGYPGFASYSASKFALRGFSEALRRELADGPVRVLYFAPRATRTPLNGAALVELNAELGTAMDAPAQVAAELVRLLQRPVRERLLGWPEKVFARLNQIVPALVDRGLRRQLPIIRTHAQRGHPRPAAAAAPVQSPEGGSP